MFSRTNCGCCERKPISHKRILQMNCTLAVSPFPNGNREFLFQKSKTHFHQRLFSCFLGCLAESTAARYPNYRNHGSAGITILRFFAVYARHLSAIGYHYAGWKIDAREALQLEQILCALDHIMQDIRKLKQTFSAAYTTNTTGVSGSES